MDPMTAALVACAESLIAEIQRRDGHRCSSVLLAGEAVVVLRYPDDGRARGLECSACSSNHKEG